MKGGVVVSKTLSTYNKDRDYTEFRLRPTKHRVDATPNKRISNKSVHTGQARINERRSDQYTEKLCRQRSRQRMQQSLQIRV